MWSTFDNGVHTELDFSMFSSYVPVHFFLLLMIWLYVCINLVKNNLYMYNYIFSQD